MEVWFEWYPLRLSDDKSELPTRIELVTLSNVPLAQLYPEAFWKLKMNGGFQKGDVSD